MKLNRGGCTGGCGPRIEVIVKLEKSRGEGSRWGKVVSGGCDQRIDDIL